MNAYLADQIAREHVNTLVAAAGRARRARVAKAARHNRAALQHTSHSDIAAAATVADSTAGHRRPARRINRPFAAVHAWIASGQL